MAAGRRLLHFGLGSGTGPRGLLVQFGHEGWWHTCSGIRNRLVLMDCRDTLLSRVTSVREISYDPVIHICSRNGGGETGPGAFKETG